MIRPSLVIESEHDFQLSLLLEDDSGVISARDYNDIVAGVPNLLMINHLGFSGYEKQEKAIRSLTLRIHSGINKDKFKIRVDDLLILRNPVEIESRLQSFKNGYFYVQ